VIGVARAGRTNEHLKECVRDSVQEQGDDIDQEALGSLLKLLRSSAVSSINDLNYARIKTALLWGTHSRWMRRAALFVTPT
jgi:hypothetical protein